MKLTPRQMTTIAMVAASAAAMGYLILVILPLPGLKFALLAPLLAIMVAIPMLLTRKMGVLSLTALVLAAVMSPISLFMGLAIVVAGLVTELLGFMVFRGYTSRHAVLHVSAAFPTVSMAVTVLMPHFVLGSQVFGLVWYGLIPGICLVQAMGTVGSLVAIRALLPRIETARQRLRRE